MEVEFYKDKAGEHRWHVDDEGSILHACHEGFSSRDNSINNLMINFTLLSVAVRLFATGAEADGGAYFEKSLSGGIRWKLRAANHELVGQAHKDFDSIEEALNNMMITHTVISIFVRELALKKSAEVIGNGQG